MKRTKHLPADIGWHNWKGLFTDAALWRPVVTQICREHHLAAAERVEAGFPGSNAVFVVDEQIVIKLFPPLFVHDYPVERDAYRLIGNTLDFVPKLLLEGTYHDQIDWPYLVIEYRPGQPLRELRHLLDEANRLAVARELGRAIRAVHRLPLSGSIHFDPRPEKWQQFLRGRRTKCVDELRAKAILSESVIAEVEIFLDTTPWLDPDFAPCFINGDLTEDHLLLSAHDGEWRFSALIDWADCEAGAPEYDWIPLWFGLCGRDIAMFRAFIRAYDPELSFDQAFRGRLLVYTFLHLFGPAIVAHALGQMGDPPIQNLAHLQKLLWPLI